MVVGFTTTCAISAYHHWCCEFKSRSERSVQHYVIKFVVGFLRVLWLPPPIKLTAKIYCKSINFHCIQFSWILPTGQIRGYLFSCISYCAKSKKKWTFRSTSLLADDVLYWQDQIVLRITTFVMWNLLTLFYLNSKLTYVHSL